MDSPLAYLDDFACCSFGCPGDPESRFFPEQGLSDPRKKKKKCCKKYKKKGKDSCKDCPKR